MALRKIIQIDGEAFIRTAEGSISLGQQKGAFTAYCKVVNISANKESGRVTVECASDNNLVNKQYTVNLSVEEGAPNFIKQAYIELKKMPEWADATDC
jgi:hypothetical protein